MRYYHIIVSYPPDPTVILNDGTPVGDNAGKVYRQWSSLRNGVNDAGALNIQVDIQNAAYASPSGYSTIMIEGVALTDLGNSANFANMSINIFGGMSSGLPLANPKQQGLILSGFIFQSFGNWQGTDMSLNFVVAPSPYTLDNPANLTLNWKANTPLDQALTTCLSARGAYPNTPIKINIGQYVSNHDQIGCYSTLEQLASVLNKLTATKDNQGVSIAIQGGSIVIFDGTESQNPVNILFTDFVGQPVWIDVNQIQLKLIMRGDLNLGGYVTLPAKIQNIPGVILTSADAFPSQSRNTMNFNGLFSVSELRHVGNFRSPQGDSWVTIANCLLV